MDTRTKILSVAQNLFEQHGYRRISVDEIAQKSDIAKGTIYVHFPSKDALYVCIVDEVFSE